MDIGKQIAKYRKEKGFTQEQLAERLKYKSKLSYGKIERGEVSPTVERLEQIAEILGIHISNFFDLPTEEANFRLFYYLACEIVEHDGSPPIQLLARFLQSYYSEKKDTHVAYRWFVELMENPEFKEILTVYTSSGFEESNLYKFEKQWISWHNTKLFEEALKNNIFKSFVEKRYSLISLVSNNFINYIDDFLKKNIEKFIKAEESASLSKKKLNS